MAVEGSQGANVPGSGRETAPSPGFARLEEILAELGEGDVQIEKAFVMELGCVALLPFEEPKEDAPYPSMALKQGWEPFKNKELEPKELHEYVTKSLQGHPNVTRLEPLETEKDAIDDVTGGDAGILIEGPRFVLDIDLPRQLQIYASHPHFIHRAAVEKFQVISTGSIFGAFTEIDDYPFWTTMTEEFRELAIIQMNKGRKFWGKTVDPTPLHPTICVVFRRRDDPRPPVGRMVYTYGGDLFVVLDDGQKDPLQVLASLFREAMPALAFFYEFMLVRSLLIYDDTELGNRFEHLSVSMRNLAMVKAWRILRVGRLTRRAKLSIARIHSLLVDYESDLFALQQQARLVRDSIRRNPLLSVVKEYFTNETVQDVRMPQSVMPALAHYEEETRASSTTRAVVIASIIGAAVAAILTFLLTRLT